VNLTSSRNPSQDALLLLNDFRKMMKTLAGRFSEAPSYTEQVLAAWDARLVAAAEDATGYRLPSDVYTAYQELEVAASKRATAESLCEWIDLLGRSALELVDVQAIAETVPATPLVFSGHIELSDDYFRWEDSAVVVQTPPLLVANAA